MLSNYNINPESESYSSRVATGPRRSVEKMARRYRPVETKLGVAKGRDAIYLDAIKWVQRTNRVLLHGSLNAELCSAGDRASVEFPRYRIDFNGVLAFQNIELDSWDGESQSSFDEIIESEWIRDLGGKVTSEHRHFLVQTYDDVIEVVCESFEFTLIDTNTEQDADDQAAAAVK